MPPAKMIHMAERCELDCGKNDKKRNMKNTKSENVVFIVLNVTHTTHYAE